MIEYLIKNKYFFIAIATATFGIVVRYLNDKETETMSKKRKVSYFITGFFVGYIAYELCYILDYESWTGFVCGIGGLTSGWIINFFLKDAPKFVPDVIKKVLYKKFGVEEDKKE